MMRCWLMGLLVLMACGPSSDDIVTNLRSDNPAVREDTAKIARNFGSDAVNAALIEILVDPMEKTRLNAIESLVELEAVEAVPALALLLETDPSDLVKREAVDALGRLGDARAVPNLIAYIEAREKERPPLNAIWALGFLEAPQSLELLVRLREHDDLYVAWNANQALRNLRP